MLRASVLFFLLINGYGRGHGIGLQETRRLQLKPFDDVMQIGVFAHTDGDGVVHLGGII